MAGKTTEAGGVTNPTPNPNPGEGGEKNVTASAPQLQTATTQTTEQAQQPAQRNLDDNPDFRAFKATMQRQVAQAMQFAEQQRQEAERFRHEAEQQKLATADPEERAAILQQQLERERADYQRQQQQTTRDAQYRQKAWEKVQAAGLDTNDPRLRFEGNTVEERYESLLESISDILVQDRNKAAKDAEKLVKKEVVTALNEAGVTKTSTAGQGAALPAGEREKQDVLAEWKKVKGSGDTAAYARVRVKANKLGIDLR